MMVLELDSGFQTFDYAILEALESRPQSTITAFLRMNFHGAARRGRRGPHLQNIVALKQWQFGLAVRWRGLAGGTLTEKPP